MQAKPFAPIIVHLYAAVPRKNYRGRPHLFVHHLTISAVMLYESVFYSSKVTARAEMAG